MARNTTLTRNKIREITEHIKAGNFTVVACRLAGVSERTYYHWLEPFTLSDIPLMTHVDCITQSPTSGIRARIKEVEARHTNG